MVVPHGTLLLFLAGLRVAIAAAWVGDIGFSRLAGDESVRDLKLRVVAGQSRESLAAAFVYNSTRLVVMHRSDLPVSTTNLSASGPGGSSPWIVVGGEPFSPAGLACLPEGHSGTLRRRPLPKCRDTPYYPEQCNNDPVSFPPCKQEHKHLKFAVRANGDGTLDFWLAFADAGAGGRLTVMASIGGEAWAVKGSRGMGDCPLSTPPALTLANDGTAIVAYVGAASKTRCRCCDGSHGNMCSNQNVCTDMYSLGNVVVQKFVRNAWQVATSPPLGEYSTIGRRPNFLWLGVHRPSGALLLTYTVQRRPLPRTCFNIDSYTVQKWADVTKGNASTPWVGGWEAIASEFWTKSPKTALSADGSKLVVASYGAPNPSYFNTCEWDDVKKYARTLSLNSNATPASIGWATVGGDKYYGKAFGGSDDQSPAALGMLTDGSPVGMVANSGAVIRIFHADPSQSHGLDVCNCFRCNGGKGKCTRDDPSSCYSASGKIWRPNYNHGIFNRGIEDTSPAARDPCGKFDRVRGYNTLRCERCWPLELKTDGSGRSGLRCPGESASYTRACYTTSASVCSCASPDGDWVPAPPLPSAATPWEKNREPELAVLQDNSVVVVVTGTNGDASLFRLLATASPTAAPTKAPTSPTAAPTTSPTAAPTLAPTLAPSGSPTRTPTSPTAAPTLSPTVSPTLIHPCASGNHLCDKVHGACLPGTLPPDLRAMYHNQKVMETVYNGSENVDFKTYNISTSGAEQLCDNHEKSWLSHEPTIRCQTYICTCACTRDDTWSFPDGCVRHPRWKVPLGMTFAHPNDRNNNTCVQVTRAPTRHPTVWPTGSPIMSPTAYPTACGYDCNQVDRAKSELDRFKQILKDTQREYDAAAAAAAQFPEGSSERYYADQRVQDMQESLDRAKADVVQQQADHELAKETEHQNRAARTTGMLILGGLGLLVVAIIVLVVYCCCCRRRRSDVPELTQGALDKLELQPPRQTTLEGHDASAGVVAAPPVPSWDGPLRDAPTPDSTAVEGSPLPRV